MSDNSTNICPNCQHVNSEDYHYCELCGQKNKPLRITFFDFIKDFLDVVFNLDNKFWKTIKLLFIPGRLTKVFFQGKRKSFYHPLRLYLVAVIYLFTILSILKVDNLINFDENSDLKGRSEKRELVKQQAEVINNTLDSLSTTYLDKRSKSVIDSVKNNLFLVNENDTAFITQPITSDSTSISMFYSKVTFSSEELLLKDIDQVLDEKNVHYFIDRLGYTQFMKGARDINSFNAYIFANLTWLFLAIIPVFSLILKVFYIRRDHYYMEHFVFLLHLFTALTFLLSTAMLVLIPFDQTTPCIAFAGVVASIFPYLAFKKYYGQSIMRTFIKFLVIGFCFLIAFIMTFLVFILISAALF
jgi:hypothetical protein